MSTLARVDTLTKLGILADAAKYDASCASSGAGKRDSSKTGGIGSTEGMGICHSLHARRPLCVAAEDPAHQLLHLRLRLLCQPRVEQRAARALHHRRSRAAHAGLLQAQLHRRLVPLERDHPRQRLHDGTPGRSRSMPARRPSLRRLHPPQDDPGSIARTACRSGSVRRPPEHQRRTPTETGLRTRAGEKPATNPQRDGRPSLAHRRGQRARKPRRCTSRRNSRPPGRAHRDVGADGADDRAILLASDNSTATIGCGGCTTPASARFPTPPRSCRCKRHRCYANTGCTRPTGCCGSTDSASTKSRLPMHPRRCSPWTSIRNSPGRCATPNAFRWTSTPRRRKCCCAFRGWARATSRASCNRAGMVVSVSAISRDCARRWRKCCRS